MNRPALRVILFGLMACGGGDDGADPHAATTCTGWTDNQGNAITGTCEAACEMPPVTTSEQCDTVVKLGCAAFEFSGTKGCCVQQSGAIKFCECQ